MKEIEVAVDWWSNNIVKPKMDNGSDDLAMMVVFSMALDKLPELSEEQHKLFKNKLTELILADVMLYRTSTISVDYEPDRILSEAAEAANIGEDHFPIKTIMRVEDGLVTVRHGNGAPHETLYETVEYWERQVLQAEKDLTYYKVDMVSEFPKYEPGVYELSIRSIEKSIERYKAEISRITEAK